jgi:hypothetical protein
MMISSFYRYNKPQPINENIAKLRLLESIVNLLLTLTAEIDHICTIFLDGVKIK